MKRTMKRFIAAGLTLALALSGMGAGGWQTVFADAAAGNAVTGREAGKTVVEILPDYYEKGWEKIASEEELRNLLDAIAEEDTCEGKKYVLTEDLDMRNVPVIWENYKAEFGGILDGGGHKITNLNLQNTGADYIGLFPQTSETAEIRNLIFEDVSITADNRGDYAGVAAGYNSGKIINCHTRGKEISTSSPCHMGGIAGENRGKIYSCSNQMSFQFGNKDYGFSVGGIAAKNAGSAEIANCANTGTIEIVSYKNNTMGIGGIVGYGSGSKNKIESCYNAGEVSGSSGYVGSVLGCNSSGNVISCYYTGESAVGYGKNSGTITASAYAASAMKQRDFLNKLNQYCEAKKEADLWLPWEFRQGEASAFPLHRKIKNIGNGQWSAELTIQADTVKCTGSARTPDVSLEVDGAVLEEGTDYTVAYTNNCDPGSAQVTVEGTGNYAGSITGYFDIVGDLSEEVCSTKVTVTEDGEANVIRSYEPAKPAVSVSARGKELQAGKDYKVTYQNNDRFGTATVVIEGLGYYTGKVEQKFKVLADISAGKYQAEVRVNSEGVYYNAKPQTPAVTVISNGVTLEEGTDYQISYAENVEPGHAQVTVEGLGNYTGNARADFDIIVDLAAEISNTKVTVTEDGAGNVINSYEAAKPAVNVSALGQSLQEGIDYTLTYKNNDRMGTAVAVVEGMGGYAGKVEQEFKVLADISAGKYQAEVLIASADVYYNAMPQTPAVTVISNGETLKEGTDYELSYMNNVKVGTAAVTVTGIGNYTGTETGTFTIQKKPEGIVNTTYPAVTQQPGASQYPSVVQSSNSSQNQNGSQSRQAVKAVKGLKAKAGKKKLTATWKKLSGVSGYEVQVSQKKNFKKAKKVPVKKSRYTAKKLKSKKVYYVRVRAYKNAGNKKQYGAWTKTKTKVK